MQDQPLHFHYSSLHLHTLLRASDNSGKVFYLGRRSEEETLFRQLKVREVDGWHSLTNRFLAKQKKRHWTLLGAIVISARKVVHLDRWCLFKLGEFKYFMYSSSGYFQQFSSNFGLFFFCFSYRSVVPNISGSSCSPSFSNFLSSLFSLVSFSHNLIQVLGMYLLMMSMLFQKQ